MDANSDASRMGAADASRMGAADASRMGAADAKTGPDAPVQTTYAPVQIDFEDLPAGTILTDQYGAHASFSTDSSSQVTVWNFYDFGTGQYIQTGLTYGFSGFPLYVDFAKPIRNLKFIMLGANSNSECAQLRIIHGGVTDTAPLVGYGSPTTPLSVDVSSYDQVTRIEIVNITDLDSLGFDAFHFDFPNE
jgi:hypothetical protein